MKLNRWICVVAGLLAAGITVAAVQQPPAQATKPSIKRTAATPLDSVDGKETYDAYCAVCHGRDGKGKGPAAPALKAPLPDLTTIAKRNGGEYSQTAVESEIKGFNTTPSAHGSADMPIWGPIFNAMSYSPGITTLRLSNLVKYIGTMQGK